MLQAVLKKDGKIRLNVDSMDGCSIANVKVKDKMQWGYDEDRNLPFMCFDVGFTFKENLKKYHSMHVIKYHGEKEFFVSGILIHFIYSEFSTDFYFHQKDIKEDPILTKLAKEMERLCRIPILTTFSFSEPEWKNHSNNCTNCSIKRRGK